MKKAFKKLMAITLTLLMLLPFMSMYSFAAAAPEIVSVEVEFDKELSLKEIDEGIKSSEEFLLKMAEEYGIDIYDEQFQKILNEMMGITLEDVFADYLYGCAYKVTLSNGEVLVSDSGYSNFDYGRYKINCSAYVTKKAYNEAVEKGADTVEVTVEGVVKRYIPLTGTFKIYSEYKNTFDAPCFECYVKDLQIISGVPDAVNVNVDYIPLDGAQIKVIYPDGTSETGTVKEIIVNDEDVSLQYNYIEYELLGQELEVSTRGLYDEENTYISFYYKDFELKKDVNAVDENDFKGIKITDYNLNDDGEIIDVTYDITFADDTTRTYTDNVEENGIMKSGIDTGYGFVYGARFIDGYSVGIDYIENYPEDASNKYEYGFSVSIGDCHDEVILGEAESNGAAGIIIARLLATFKALLARFVEIISNILGK
ncbi:MAG: hypothetical protein ACI4GC_07920 [Acutalibacteraceae bacterium]